MLVENQKIKIDIKGKKRIIYRFRNLGYQIDDDQDFLYVKPEDLAIIIFTSGTTGTSVL